MQSLPLRTSSIRRLRRSPVPSSSSPSYRVVPAPTMRLSSSSLWWAPCLALIPSSITTTTAFTTTSTSRRRHLQSSSSTQTRIQRRPLRLRATTASSSSDLASATAAIDDDGVMAVGHVVSRFPGGGLTVVQMHDDDGHAAGELLGRRVVLPGRTGHALVVAHRPPLAFCYHPGDDDDEDAEAFHGEARVLRSLARVSTREAPAVDALGASLADDDAMTIDEGDAANTEGRPLFGPIPPVGAIALIDAPVLTGITALDVLAPLGRGQNMLWITHDAVTARRYLSDWLRGLTDRDDDTHVVYAALDTTDGMRRELPDRVQVVARSSNTTVDPVVRAAEGVAMAAAACALAEQHALDDGGHALVVVDALDGHRTLWDATTRVLVDVFGVDAVVKGDRDGGSEMRAYYSSLIQRSAQYKAKRGGGSVTLVLLSTLPPASGADDDVFTERDFATAPPKVQERIRVLIQKKIPLTEATLRKIQIPVPSVAEGRRRLVLQHTDDLISMSDGQIWFDDDVVDGQQKRWPPLDPQRSVTRVGIGADTVSRADAPALSRVTEGLRLRLSQERDDLPPQEDGGVGRTPDPATRRRMSRRRALQLVLHQRPGTGARRLSESCALLLAATEGLLDDTVSDESNLAGRRGGDRAVSALLRHLHETLADTMKEIDETLDLTDENKARLLEALRSHLT